MKRLEQAGKYLRKAADDETLLDAVMGMANVSDDIFGFHCQQAAEKLLKAFLSALALRFQKTHDLQELMTLLENAGHALPHELTHVDELTPFAVQWRYDYFTPSTPFDRKMARELIRHLHAYVEERIKALK